MPSSAASAAIASCLRANVKRSLADVQFEVLGHLVLVDDLAHAQTDRIGALELARIHAVLDLLQVTFGGREQLLALVRAQRRQLRIAAGHQALAGVVRRSDLEQVALIEQAQLKMPLLDQCADRCALQRRDPADAVGLAQLVDGLAARPYPDRQP